MQAQDVHQIKLELAKQQMLRAERWQWWRDRAGDLGWACWNGVTVLAMGGAAAAMLIQPLNQRGEDWYAAQAWLPKAIAPKAASSGEVASPLVGVTLDQAIAYQPGEGQGFDAGRDRDGDGIEEATHGGVDFDSSIGAGQGGKVQAVVGGAVEVVPIGDNAEGQGGSVQVRVTTGDGTEYRYGHLNKASVGAALGGQRQVEAGQVLGFVGSTDNLSDGPHLDFKVLQDGQFVEPQKHLASLAPAPKASGEPEKAIAPQAQEYFDEIAYGSEFGGSDSRVLRRWEGSVRIVVHGQPDQASLAELDRVIGELRELTGLDIARVQQDGDIDFHFADHGQFQHLHSGYVPGNLGFAWVNWQGSKIVEGLIMITTSNEISQLERSHLIREELTQAMGLLKDSERYEDSIFYQGWTSVTEYSALDREVIRMLYRNENG